MQREILESARLLLGTYLKDQHASFERAKEATVQFLHVHDLLAQR